MANINTLGYLFIFLIIVISLNLYHYSDSLLLTCINSKIDGNQYCVRDDDDTQKSADMLAQLTVNCKHLVRHLESKYKDKDERVNRLLSGFKPNKVYEILPTSKFTAYSENKGQKLAFCLNTTKKGNVPIDLNTLTFVAIHELAHIATKSRGHTEEFWRNMQFLVIEGEECGIYKVIDYSKHPIKYCGMEITSNPYFRKNKTPNKSEKGKIYFDV